MEAKRVLFFSLFKLLTVCVGGYEKNIQVRNKVNETWRKYALVDCVEICDFVKVNFKEIAFSKKIYLND